MKRVLFTALGWSAGGVIGWLALRRVDWGEAIVGVRQVEWSVIFMAVAAVLFAHYLKAHRWKLLLPGEQISAGRLFLMRNVGAALHTVSPVRGVSEIAQLTLLHRRDGIPAPKVVASFVVGHLLDLVVSANMVAIGLVMLPAFEPYRPVVVGIAAGSAVLLLLTPFLARAIGNIGLVRRRRLVHETLAAIRSAQSSKRTLVACMALTALGWAYIGLAAWMIADAMGIGLPYWTVAVITVTIVRFAGVIPTPPALVGVYEAVAVAALGLFGVAPPLALSFALVTHAVIFVPPVLIGALVLVVERSALFNAFDSLLAPLRQPRFRLQPQETPK
ncbi:MAG: flippase-like domain-containing protein [Chloroflexi bacterium]|nr:flippase-like domain-containing protein [Chloroflexota bacterium]